MQNVFLLNPYEIIKDWSDFRKQLKTKSKKEILTEVNAYWWKAPTVTYLMDYEKPESWPTPWELIFENQFDDTARAYIMAETIYMIETNVFENSKINLTIVKDYEFEKTRSILIVDNFVLNYCYDTLCEYSDIEKNIYRMITYERRYQGKWIEI